MLEIKSRRIRRNFTNLEHKLKLSSLEKSKLILKTIKVRHNLTLEDEKDNIKKILKQFERHVKKYSKLKQNKLVAELEIWRNEVGIKLPGNLPVAASSSSRGDVEEDGAPQAKRGRKSKRLSDQPEKRTYNKILDDFVDIVEKHASEQGVDKSEYLKEVVQRCEKRWGKMEGVKLSTISVQEAIALIYNLDLSINKYHVKYAIKYCCS
ncbi:uncharacterized protein LOC136088168 [Hydra vulgaris]|uniref:Uncharacterized protein LOC136088168 n=1 Tax=Hydra vulgaris TaxID=6087 RepID=A0ABM4D121_HYDVU